MSHTDKTKPRPIRILETGPVEHHDHRFGPCDLPTAPNQLWRDAQWIAKRTNCYWDAPPEFEASWSHCGCGLDHYGESSRRRAEIRRERRAKRLGEAEALPRPKAKKDTWRWCRGKPGREHVREIRYSKHALWRLGHGITPCEPAPQWMTRHKGWLCYHEEGCAVCGKVLSGTLYAERCPIWLSRG